MEYPVMNTWISISQDNIIKIAKCCELVDDCVIKMINKNATNTIEPGNLNGAIERNSKSCNRYFRAMHISKLFVKK